MVETLNSYVVANHRSQHNNHKVCATKPHFVMSFSIFSVATVILALSAITFTKNCNYRGAFEQPNLIPTTLKKDELIPLLSTKLLQIASDNGKYGRWFS